ncbi:restriction endonuclease FokI C-terminal domain-containing protein [Hornefia butyriciproducens]|uniref:restriction endonuclease FokI C-terminal domain-containing protein n=1 Tax=Hornefia butyriciproducens TaxID=2652293 RepID=UPI003F8A6B50
MAERTFGWVQEAYTLSSLKDCVSVFVKGSEIHRQLIEDKIPRLVAKRHKREEFLRELTVDGDIIIPYPHLKGKGNVEGSTRATAPCTGIFQAALKGQRKEYQSDWPADSYARWAVSVGFLLYDRSTDSCSITELGKEFVEAETNSDEENEILIKAFGKNPPIVRVMDLLATEGRLTKFEIGQQLGFKSEAGFTSIPQKFLLQMIHDEPEKRKKFLADTEGTSDKYARTICGWLKKIGWVVQIEKEVTEELNGNIYTDTLPQAYELTSKGLTALRKMKGESRHAKVPYKVFWEMLSSKPADRSYIRNRRAEIINYITRGYHTIDEIYSMLLKKGYDETREIVTEDLRGLENMGMHVVSNRNAYKISDYVEGLVIPAEAIGAVNADTSVLKNVLRKKLSRINHDYLVLIDLAYDGNSNRDFEFKTAEFLTDELGFEGARLGDTRKPDVCVYEGADGLIIDNKAYSRGYSLSMNQADEMIRYIEENKARDEALNPNKWWKVFPSYVSDYGYSFVSSEFVGGFQDRLDYIKSRTSYDGSCVSAMNILLLGEKVLNGEIDRTDFFTRLKCNSELCFDAYEFETDYDRQMVAENTNIEYD